MDERSRLRVRARRRRVPKRPAQINRPELVRVHIRERARVRARAVIREAREVVPRYVVEVALHGAVPPVVVRPEPRGVPRSAARRAVEVGRRVRRVVGRVGRCRVEVRLLAVRAPVVVRAPADPSDSAEEAGAADDREITPGESGGVRRSGVGGERGDVVVGVDDEEGVGRGDGVRAVPAFGEVVRGRDCRQEVTINDHPIDLDTESREGLTIVSDGHSRAGGKHGEHGRVRRFRGLARRVLNPYTSETGSGTAASGDGEGVSRKGVEDTVGVVEELEGLIAGVSERGDDLQVLDTIDSVGAGDLQR